MRKIIVIIALLSALVFGEGKLAGFYYDANGVPTASINSAKLVLYGCITDSITDTTAFDHFQHSFSWTLPDSLDTCDIVYWWVFVSADSTDTSYWSGYWTDKRVFSNPDSIAVKVEQLLDSKGYKPRRGCGCQ